MSELNQQARDLLRRFPLIDGHNDLPWALRERAAGDASKVRFTPPAKIPAEVPADLAAVPGDPAEVNLAARVAGLHTDLPRLAAGEWALSRLDADKHVERGLHEPCR